MKLHENGAYLIQGKNVVIDSSEALKEVKGKTGKDIAKNEAKQNTIAYNILKNHNTSGNTEKTSFGAFDKGTRFSALYCSAKQKTSDCRKNLADL